MKTVLLLIIITLNYAICNSQSAYKPISRIFTWYYSTTFNLNQYRPPSNYNSVTTWTGDQLWNEWRETLPWGWDSLRTNYYNSKDPDFLYGRVDVCMRIDSMHNDSTGVMAHTAAWLLIIRDIVQEIDIVEYTGNRLLFSAHWNKVNSHYKNPVTGKFDPNYRRYIHGHVPDFDVTDYYVYSVEWTPRKIKWYINSEPVAVLYIKLDHPMFFIFSNIRQDTVLWVNVWRNLY